MRLIAKLSVNELDTIDKALHILYELRDYKAGIYDLDEAIECLEGIYSDGK